LQIAVALNNDFNSTSTGLANTRKYFGREDPTDAQHTLARVAHRLKATPTDTTARGRWFGLLDYIDTDASLAAARTAIRGALHRALSTRTIVAVVFDVLKDPANGQQYSVTTNTTDSVIYLSLLCPGHDYNGPVHPPAYIPPRDPGEPAGSRRILKHE
jgi:hypothetical protein